MSHCDHHHGHLGGRSSDHSCSDDHATSARLTWALVVIAVFMVIEIVGGLLSGSLALLADAAHMFTDALALALAAVAQRFAARPPDARLHFGYRRAQVLAAFANGVFMLCLLFVILSEAVRRLFNPVDINAGLMFWIAVAGFAANAAAFLILHRPEERNLNMRGAQLHVLGDLVGSVAAIIAAAVISATGFTRIDPIVSLIAVALIGFYAVRLLRQTSHILLEGAPDNIDLDLLTREVVGAAPQIEDVHEVRVWQITPEHPRATLHIRVDDAAGGADAVEKVKDLLRKKYRIESSTVQVDIGGERAEGSLIARGHAAPEGAPIDEGLAREPALATSSE
ncbi:MAG: cation diffusion facilitator family transporter [Pseudomonadota bacterium]